MVDIEKPQQNLIYYFHGEDELHLVRVASHSELFR